MPHLVSPIINLLIWTQHHFALRYRRLDVLNLYCSVSLLALKSPCSRYSFSPTDNKFVSCSDDGTVRLWDFVTCNEERIFRGEGCAPTTHFYSFRLVQQKCSYLMSNLFQGMVLTSNVFTGIRIRVQSLPVAKITSSQLNYGIRGPENQQPPCKKFFTPLCAFVRPNSNPDVCDPHLQTRSQVYRHGYQVEPKWKLGGHCIQGPFNKVVRHQESE